MPQSDAGVWNRGGVMKQLTAVITAALVAPIVPATTLALLSLVNPLASAG